MIEASNSLPEPQKSSGIDPARQDVIDKIQEIEELKQEEDQRLEQLGKKAKAQATQRDDYFEKLKNKTSELADAIGINPNILLSTNEKLKEDYSKVFQIIKSQEQQFISQLSETRKIASTWLLGTLGGISILLVQKKDELLLIDQHLLISLIAAMGALGLCMLWVLDRKVYHRLLNATILEGLAIENTANNVPTKVRTHTLRITGQLGYPISIFYLFPISFLLFISLSFYYKFNPWSCLSFAITFVYFLLLLFLCLLSIPESLSDLAIKIGRFEEHIKKKECLEHILFNPDRTTGSLENNDWNQLAYSLYRIFQLRRNEKIKYISSNSKTLEEKKADDIWVCGSVFVAILLLIAIVVIYGYSLNLDSQKTKLTQDQTILDKQTSVIMDLGRSLSGSNNLEIEIQNNLSSNICDSLNRVSSNQINSEDKTYCSNNTDNISDIEIVTKQIDTNQIKLIQQILKINGVKNTTEQNDSIKDKIIIKSK